MVLIERSNEGIVRSVILDNVSIFNNSLIFTVTEIKKKQVARLLEKFFLAYKKTKEKHLLTDFRVNWITF